jgi:poly(A) polymerase
MTRLRNRAFLKDASALAVLDALDAAGSGQTRFVGGAVRDGLRGVQHGGTKADIDLATQLTPDMVVAALEAVGLKAVPTGIAHGTVTAIAHGKPVEVTTLRRDLETNGRHAVVAFTDDWGADAARRDFTMNSLYCDRDGTVSDPTTAGVADALAGRVVFVGDPACRIAEDGLRILRFFRFHAWHGHGEPDGAGLNACAERADDLAALSAERVWKETRRLLEAPDPRVALRAMAASGVLARVLPEAHGLDLLDRLVDIEASLFLDIDPMQRLMALVPREPGLVAGLGTRFRLSNAEADRLTGWASDQTRIVSFLSAREVRAALYRMGRPVWLDRVRLAWALDGGPRRASQWRALAAMADGFVAPKFPINGTHVVAAGCRPGAPVGAVLREVERWWVDNDFIDDDLSLAERLKAVVQGLG